MACGQPSILNSNSPCVPQHKYLKKKDQGISLALLCLLALTRLWPYPEAPANCY